MLLPLIARSHHRLRDSKNALKTPLTSLSHVLAKMQCIYKFEETPIFDNEIVNQSIVNATLEANALLKHWVIIHSYIPYLAGFHVWDMVMLGASVQFQHKRHQPMPRNERAYTNELMDRISLSSFTKVWISIFSPLQCRLSATDAQHTEEEKELYKKACTNEDMDCNIQALNGYSKSIETLKQQEAVVYMHGDKAISTFGRSTSEWKDIEARDMLEKVVNLKFQQSSDFPHTARQQSPSDILQPLQTPAQPHQPVVRHEPKKPESDQPPAAVGSGNHPPAAVGSNTPSEHTLPPAAPSPPH